MKLLQSDTVKL